MCDVMCYDVLRRFVELWYETSQVIYLYPALVWPRDTVLENVSLGTIRNSFKKNGDIFITFEV